MVLANNELFVYNGLMSDFLKEKISYYKLLLTFFVTALYGITGWYFNKNFSISNAMTTLLMLSFIGMLISMSVIVHKIRYYTNKLEDED